MSDAGRLYDRYGPSLYRYALMLLADRRAAEDAVQQVFVSLLKQGGRAVIENEEHYLRRAIRNECYSMLRRPKRIEVAVSDEALLVPLSGQEVSLEECLTIEKAMRALVPRYLTAVPIDPFDGTPLRYVKAEASYTIYSVGSNRADDNGDLISELMEARQKGFGPQRLRGRDVGVRVLTSR